MTNSNEWGSVVLLIAGAAVLIGVGWLVVWGIQGFPPYRF